MKRKINLLLTLILIGSILLVVGVNKNKDKNEKDNIKIEDNVSKDDVEIEEEEEVEPPKVSQVVTEFPWDEDVDFKKAQEENNTDVLIAGFCTVLETSTPEERVNIDLATNTVTGTVIAPGEVFSQNETAGPYTEEKGYQEGSGYVGNTIVKSMGGGVCKVASTLYNTAIFSNLDIVERYNHSMPVPYVPYGQDAAVAFGSKDFRFKNNTEDNILIWAKLIDNRVYMGFYGKEEAPEMEWEHETINTTEAPTEYKVNPELKEGEENTLVNGMDGKVVNSSIIIKDKDGSEKIKELGKSSYLPMTNLIERSQ